MSEEHQNVIVIVSLSSAMCNTLERTRLRVQKGKARLGKFSDGRMTGLLSFEDEVSGLFQGFLREPRAIFVDENKCL